MRLKLQEMRKLRIRGQGMTEYIIIVALIAIAAIATTMLFGSTVRAQVAAMAGGLAGNTSAASKGKDQAKSSSDNAATAGTKARGLNEFSDDVVARN